MNDRVYDVILSELRAKRFYHLDEAISEEMFGEMAARLGKVIRAEDIRLNVSRRLVHRPEPLRFHTDQSYVDLLAWHCLEPDVRCPTLLLDIVELLRGFDLETLRLLEQAVVMCPNPDNLAEVVPEPLFALEDGYVKLFYIAFRGSERMDGAVRRAWDDFVKFVDVEGPKHAFPILLKRGECLFLHNRSYFHARPALAPDSPRFLKRLWIQSDLVPGVKFRGDQDHGE